MNDPSLPHDPRTADVGAGHGCRTEFVPGPLPLLAVQAGQPSPCTGTHSSHRVRHVGAVRRRGSRPRPHEGAARRRDGRQPHRRRRPRRQRHHSAPHLWLPGGTPGATDPPADRGTDPRRAAGSARHGCARGCGRHPQASASPHRRGLERPPPRCRHRSVHRDAAPVTGRATGEGRDRPRRHPRLREAGTGPPPDPHDRRAPSAERRASDAARRYATARGWRPPLAWDDIDAGTPGAGSSDAGLGSVVDDVDEIAVERAMTSDRVRLRPNERDEAIRRLTARGMSLRQIAARAGVSPRTVGRRRRAPRTSRPSPGTRA